MFVNEKTEKDTKIKELAILKDSSKEQVPEYKELKVKYETLKINHNKEYNLRKEKE